VGRDEVGDVVAVDEVGVVWCFAHGAGDWKGKVKAFADEGQLQQFVAFQHELEPPKDDESLDELRARRKRIEAWMRGRRGAPFARDAVRAAIDDLKERIEDLRFSSSKRGRSIAARQELGQRCEAALAEAGANGRWMVRAHAENPRALIVVGPFAEPWTHAAVIELLQPLVDGCELICHG